MSAEGTVVSMTGPHRGHPTIAGPVVETSSGLFVNLMEPTVDQIRFGDIAQALSGIARYNNHTLGVTPYSVAQHSVWCAMAARRHHGVDEQALLHVLLHDAHEAYMGDIVAPLKHLPTVQAALSPIEARLQAVILEALELSPPDEATQKLIKHVDRLALAVEAWHLAPSRGRDWDIPRASPQLLATFKAPMGPHDAMQAFWMCYEFLRHGLPLEELA